MKLKSYQSNSVEAAIRLAKVELGDEAIFMGSRENGPGDESSARYEVTFALAVGDGRTPGGPEADVPDTGANGSGEPRLLRPAWTGRAFGGSKEARMTGSAREADSSGARESRPAAQRHWQNFLPEGMRLPRPSQQPAVVKPADASGSAERPRAVPVSAVRVTDTEANETAMAGARKGNDPVASVTIPAVRAVPPDADNRLFAVIEHLFQEANQLRDLVDERQRAAPPSVDGAPKDAPKDMVELARSNGIELLISQGMCASAARSLVGEALSGCPRPIPANGLQQQLEASIARGCRVDATLGRPASPSEPAIAAFVGPAGAGKTSVICKLAVRLGMEADRPVRLVSVDPYRLGASEQLGSLADLLDAPFTLVEDCREALAAVRRAITRTRDTKPPLILIDTPGYGPAEWKQARNLANAFADLPGLDTHMVVAATSSAGHLHRTLDAFRIFHPRKLLITKLDECAEAGAIVGETLRFRLPISFFSTGQRIPEDIAAANPGRLAQQLLQAF
jgi:flagellar biosynthesis GTPase FlhF